MFVRVKWWESWGSGKYGCEIRKKNENDSLMDEHYFILQDKKFIEQQWALGSVVLGFFVCKFHSSCISLILTYIHQP